MALNQFVNSGTDEATVQDMKKSIAREEDLQKAMNKAGLVQKEVQVQGKNGQTFTRKQWVKVSEDISQPNTSTTTPNDESKKSEYSFKPFEVGSNNVSAYVNRRKFGQYQLNNIYAALAGHSKEFKSKTSKTEAVRACKEAIRTHKRGIKNENYRGVEYSVEKLEAIVQAETKLLEILEAIPVAGENQQPPKNEDKQKDDVMQKWKDKADAGDFTDEVKKELKYGIDTKAAALVEKDGKYKTAKTWDEADYANKQGWKTVGSITDILNRGKLPENKTTQQSNQSDTNSVEYKLDKTKSGKVGAVWSIESNGKKESATVVNKIPDGYRKHTDITVEGRNFTIYTNGNELLATENDMDNKADSQQTDKNTQQTDSKDGSNKSFITPRSKSLLTSLLQQGVSREDIMAQAEKDGVTWNKHSHPGINWMRASMAMTGTSTKGNKKADAIKPEERKAEKSSVIGKDYTKLTTGEESNTPEGEAHNMIVGALGRKKNPSDLDVRIAASGLAKDYVKHSLSFNSDHNTKLANRFVEISGDNRTNIVRDIAMEKFGSKETKAYALQELLGKDYKVTPGNTLETSVDVGGKYEVQVKIEPKNGGSGGYFRAEFVYADGASRAETYDSIDVLKEAADKFIQKEKDYNGGK